MPFEYEKWHDHRKRASLVGLLSPQEERVMRLRAQGIVVKEIAHLLDLSEQTVKNHTGSVLRKLDADSVQGAFLKLGWTVIPDEPIDERAQCDYVGRCGRAADHRGQHGGFRPVPQNFVTASNESSSAAATAPDPTQRK